ncbi:MAG: oligosaccharide flippase family protein [Candidatus Cloacimonetes bacterium]|nr:oligosaccharide flippase family protein [Candidatus Cloacimonadota bacterium]
MLDKIRSSVKQTFYYGIGNVAVKLVGFILLPLYARQFSIEIYGLLALFEILAEIIITLSSFGVESGFNRWYWDDEGKERQKSLFFTTLIFSLISTTLCLILAFVMIHYYSLQIFDVKISLGLTVTYLVNILFRVVIMRSILLMQIQQLVVKQTRYVLLNLGIVLLTTIFFITQLDMGLEGVFLGQICGNVIVLIFIMPYLLKEIKFVIEYEIFSKLLKYSFPIAVSSVFAIVMTLSDRFILKHYYSLADVGQYSLAYKVSSLIKLFIVRSFLKSYNFKYYSEIEAVKHDRFFDKSITYFTFIAIYSGLLLSIVSKTVIKFLTDNVDYYNSLYIVPYLVAGIILYGIRSMLNMPMAKMKRTDLIAYIAVGTGILNILLNFLIIPSLGSLGAALTTAVSQGVAVIVCLMINKKYGYSNYEVVKYLKAFLIGIGLLYAWLLIPEMNVFLSILVDLVILLLYPVILAVIGFFEDTELQRIRQSLKKWSKPANIKALIKKEYGGK